MFRSWAALGLAIAMAGCGGPTGPPQPANSHPAPSDESKSPMTHGPEWGAAMDGLRAKIAFTDAGPEFRAGDPIVVSFVLQNVSDEPQIVMHRGFWPNHRLHVVDSAGNPLRRTPEGQRLDELFGNVEIDEKTASARLAPQELDDAWEPVDLTPLFIFDGPGEYTVWYEYQRNRDTIVESNRLPFKLVE